MRVFVAQFIKKGDFSEVKAIKRLSRQDSFKIKIKQYGEGRFICDKPSSSAIDLAKSALNEICTMFEKGDYDVYILDEACCAIKCGLFSENDLLKLIDKKPANVELIITGRDAPKKLIRRADYITEMRCVKHPYHTRKLKARCGIEY